MNQAETNSFPFSDSNKRYHTYDYYLRHRYGQKCAKVPLDGGFTCPNIDGTISRGGCTFCTARGSGDFCAPATQSIRAQYDALVARTEKKWHGTKFIPYLQAFSNTYGSIEKIKSVYEQAASLPDAVCLNIATRPDCLPEAVLDVLSELQSKIDIVVELGLQSIHDETLLRINRGHDYAAFCKGYDALTARNIPVCVHLINGLPGEDAEMMLETARAMAALHPAFLKIHSLHILRGTEMAEQYTCGAFSLLTRAEYVDITCRQLELLPPDIVIARVMGDGKADDLLAPDWCQKKLVLLNEIDKWFVLHDSVQGK